MTYDRKYYTIKLWHTIQSPIHKSCDMPYYNIHYRYDMPLTKSSTECVTLLQCLWHTIHSVSFHTMSLLLTYTLRSDYIQFTLDFSPQSINSLHCRDITKEKKVAIFTCVGGARSLQWFVFQSFPCRVSEKLLCLRDLYEAVARYRLALDSLSMWELDSPIFLHYIAYGIQVWIYVNGFLSLKENICIICSQWIMIEIVGI